MGALILVSHDGARRILIDRAETLLGRAPDVAVVLDGGNVSRRHARILRRQDRYYVEDLGSINGTFLNGKRLAQRAALHPNDELRIGSHAFHLRPDKEDLFTVEAETLVAPHNSEILKSNPAGKLQAVLQIAHDLGNTLELDTVLNRFADHVLLLFSKADRVVILLLENEVAIPRVIRSRRPAQSETRLYSRSILKVITERGVAVLAASVEDVEENKSLRRMGVQSLLCVPMRAGGSPTFGAVQLDRFQLDNRFTHDDLHLLTAITLQVSLLVESVRLHERIVVQERLARELALAREIQLAFLPNLVPVLAHGPVDLFGHLEPAEEIAGDFYDFVVLDASRIALVVADVSGKGIPAALFMSMVRAQFRQFVLTGKSPAEILACVNDAIAIENPKFMFVTALVVVFDTLSGECLFARAGHPAPLLLTHDGSARVVQSHPGCLLGIERPSPPIQNQALSLQPDDLLLLYTDGVTEAADASGRAFADTLLAESLREISPDRSLKDAADHILKKVQKFCGFVPPQDDITLVLLRHKPTAAASVHKHSFER